DKLSRMLGLSALIGVVSAISGFWLARWLDANIAGSMATMTGFIFLLIFIFAPERGMVALALRRQRQRLTFAATALTIHLLHHEGEQNAWDESRTEHLIEHMHWEHTF